MGIWQGVNSSNQDPFMPPLNNIPDRLEVSTGSGRYFMTMAATTDFLARHVDCTDFASESGVALAAASASVFEESGESLTCLGLCGGRIIQCLDANLTHSREESYPHLLWMFFTTGLGTTMLNR
jgi:hypothetical protein